MPVFFLIYYQHGCCKNTPYKMIEALRVQVSIYLSVSAFHLVFITLKMGGVAVGIQRKDLLGIPHGIPFDKARSALRSGFPFGIPFGEASSPSQLYSIWFDIQSNWDCCWNTEKRRMASTLVKI